MNVDSFIALLLLCLIAAGDISATTPAEMNLKKSAPVALVAPKKLLFLPFYNEARQKNFEWLETTIGNSIHEQAHLKYRYDKIPENDFTMYFINKGYALADLYNFDKITKIAHDLGVDGVIYGTFKPEPDAKHVVVTGKILSVIDKEIIAEKTVTMPVTAEMFADVAQVSDALGANIQKLFFPSDYGALVRAATLPGWGHRYKQRPGWGYAWGGTFWAGVGFLAFSTFEFVRFSIAYANYSPEHYTSPTGETGLKDPAGAQAQFDSYKQNINLWGEMTLGSIIGVALIYAGNLLHAYNIAPDIVETPNMSGQAAANTLRPKLLLCFAATQRLNTIGASERIAQVSLVWRF